MNQLRKKRIGLYLLITFVLSYALGIAFLFTGLETNSQMYALFASVIMMFPALSVLLTRLITREGFADHGIRWTWKKGNGRYYLLAWFLPAVLTILGCALYFLLFPEEFDWNMSYYYGKVAETGFSATPEELRSAIISQLITAVILGPVLNCITCFGEEWGWRGYLLPKLRESFSDLPAILLTGAIWGIWHAPLIIAGHNYGKDYPGYPYIGILLMILFCIVMGTFLSYVSIRAGSCVPAVIAHGAINSVASVGIYFTNNGGNPIFGPAISGLVGMIPTIITSVILMALLHRNKACVSDSSCDTIDEALRNGE